MAPPPSQQAAPPYGGQGGAGPAAGSTPMLQGEELDKAIERLGLVLVRQEDGQTAAMYPIPPVEESDEERTSSSARRRHRSSSSNSKSKKKRAGSEKEFHAHVARVISKRLSAHLKEGRIDRDDFKATCKKLVTNVVKKEKKRSTPYIIVEEKTDRALKKMVDEYINRSAKE